MISRAHALIGAYRGRKIQGRSKVIEHPEHTERAYIRSFISIRGVPESEITCCALYHPSRILLELGDPALPLAPYQWIAVTAAIAHYIFVLAHNKHTQLQTQLQIILFVCEAFKHCLVLTI